LNYSNAQPYSLDVLQKGVVNENSPNSLTQELAAKYNTSLETELETWFDNRIVAAGSRGTARLAIKDANFRSSPLQKKDGVEGYFTRDQAERWDATLSVVVSLEGTGPDGLSTANFTVNVSANNTVPEKSSDAEKSKIYHSLVNKLMTLFNQEADKQIRQNFSRYQR